jgi:UDP-N-acetylmuramate dehydrogenase
MNAGAHGTDVSATLNSVQILDLSSGAVETRRASSLGLSYRHSELASSALVLEARFDLRHGERDLVRERIESFRRHRAATQPGALQNAGSVFKNPPGDSAGRLVEAAGLKGFRVGGAVVSDLHANFFLASEDASAQDVFDLVNAVRDRVAEEFGVLLEPEIRFAGAFRGAATFDRQEAAT